VWANRRRSTGESDRRKLATYLSLVLEDHLASKQSETAAKPKGRKQ
jgi:hypothetical protein